MKNNIHWMSLLDENESHQVLEKWNDTAADYPRDQCIHTLFECQADKTPDATVIVQGKDTFSYREINRKANQLAHYLQRQGVQSGHRVALRLSRSMELIVAELAIMKCGAAYVPIDPSYPQGRQDMMMADCGSQCLLITEMEGGEREELDKPGSVNRIDVSAVLLLGECPAHNLENVVNSETAAYVMYTSGSTGQPKGVVIPHRAIARLIINNGYADFSPRDRVAFASHPAFDAATMEVWGPLLMGGCTVIVEQEVLLSPDSFAALLQQQKISVLFITTALFNHYSRAVPTMFCGLRYLLTGGENSDPEAFQRVFSQGKPKHLIHCYGPTETTTFAITHEVKQLESGAQNIPLGRPISNTQIYILDKQGAPVPVGVKGEIYIGGDGVALGYLNRPALTAERFLHDPYSRSQDNGRMYKTGDLGRWHDDGIIEFAGRDDDQVKIRGFRIELGEIQARLRECVGVQDVIVIADKSSAETRLIAYYTHDELSPEGEQLQAQLLRQLPDYMVPSAYVAMSSLPLTTNGKVNRKALPLPDDDAYIHSEYEAPLGEVEQVLAQIWSDLLGIERISRRDNFFTLGGHSLLVVKLMANLREAGWDLDIRTLFKNSTLADLAEEVKTAETPSIPDNHIPEACNQIKPQMLTLIDLQQEDIERIIPWVPGGAANIQDIYPLAPLQEGILFHYLLHDQRDPYLLSNLLSFSERESLDQFLNALQWAVDRYDILRTAILWQGLPEPLQVVCRKIEFVVDELEFSGDSEAVDELQSYIENYDYRMDIRCAPLLKLVSAFDTVTNRWMLLILNHHLIIDHTGLETLIAELSAYRANPHMPLPSPVPFRQFVAQTKLGASREEHQDFFRKMLGGVDEPTAPFDLLNVLSDGSDTEEFRTRLDSALATRIRRVASTFGVSVASLFHMTFAQLLGRLTGRDEVVFGTVLLGRTRTAQTSERGLGLFINTLPILIDAHKKTVAANLKDTHDLLVELLYHEHASLALAQSCSQVQSPLPLFTALMNYRHSAGAADTRSNENTYTPDRDILSSRERTNYPLTLSVDDMGEDFLLKTQVVKAAKATPINHYLSQLLGALVDALDTAPQTLCSQLHMLNEFEYQQLSDWNHTQRDFGSEVCLHQLFESQVEQTPEAIALVYEHQSLSYCQLNSRANQLAHYLIDRGVKPDSRVALCAERSLEMVVALLAILKAGGAYVPLEPSYPRARLQFILTDSEPVLLLSDAAAKNIFDINELTIPVFDLTLNRSLLLSYPDSNPVIVNLKPSHLVYVIYTSGSTGQPKGVMNEHRGVLNYLRWRQHTYSLSSADAVLQKTPFGFDVSAWEFFWPLIAGARLVIAKPQGHQEPLYLKSLIESEQVSIVHFVPSMLAVFLDQLPAKSCPSLRQMFCSGEALPLHVMQRCLACLPECQLNNLYGPTEAAIDATAWHCERDFDTVSIGRPISNVQIYILDNHGRPVPPGIAGELYIGGAGVARGYWNRPQLTEERFLMNPFCHVTEVRMYKTDDLACWREDGAIEFLGRNDFQVKIRGFRIELGEIESKLRECTGIDDALVLANQLADDTRLVAYYVSEMEQNHDALRTQLLACLPDYMVPSVYVALSAFPLTANGKLDRKALPAPGAASPIRRQYEAPKGERESILAQLWTEMLAVESISRWDNFFALGGHSLLAVKLMTQLHKKGWQLDIRLLFNSPTLAELAQTIEALDELTIPPNKIPLDAISITPEMLTLIDLNQMEIDNIVDSIPGGLGNIQDIYPLMSLQEGVLFHHLAGTRGDAYLKSSFFAFDTREHIDQFLSALQQVIDRHDIMRTAFLWQGLSNPVQVVCRDAPLMVEEKALLNDSDGTEQLQAYFVSGNCRLNVGQAPLLRAVVAFDAMKHRWLLMLLQHHLIDDHTSVRLLANEVIMHLQGKQDQLPPPIPFRQFVARAHLKIKSEEHQAFFQKMLADIDEPTAPLGVLNNNGDGSGIEECCWTLELSLAQRLRASAKMVSVSVASLFHVAFARVLSVLSGRDDVVFGTVLLGRLQGGKEIDRALGMFINTLPIRLNVNDKKAACSVEEVNSSLVDLLYHEQASLVLAQSCSGIRSQLPLFTALMNYRHSSRDKTNGTNGTDGKNPIGGIEMLGIEERTNYPLTLSIDDLDNGFLLTTQSVRPLGAEDINDYMVQVLSTLVEALENQRQTHCSQFELLNAQKKQHILEAWNTTGSLNPRIKCIHQTLEIQSEKNPEAIALVNDKETLTFQTLNQRANQLAHYLREQGVQPDSRVAICVERGPWMVVGILAILKAGGAYVPLDAAYPPERLRLILEDSDPILLLRDDKLAISQHLSHSVKSINVVGDNALWSDCSTDNPDHRHLNTAHLAYIIYTSGSTGEPKGIQQCHQTLVNLVQQQTREGLNTPLKTLQLSNIAFDVATQEIVTAWYTGSPLYLYQDDLRLDSRRLVDIINKQNIQRLFGVPSVLALLLKTIEQHQLSLPSMKEIISAGEALLMTGEMRQFLNRHPSCQLINHYGPAETHVVTTFNASDCREGDAIPIGKPLANTPCYILDKKGLPVPVGVVGELVVGGMGLARGYLNRPLLNQERFVPDPFSGEENKFIYKTGDLTRWTESGNIEFIGRNDKQIKIRGIRVEMTEIETALRQCDTIQDAVVVAHQRGGNTHLVAYCVIDVESLDIPKLREALSSILLDAMVPSAYIPLKSIPLTVNGKTDSRALPIPKEKDYYQEVYEAPTSHPEIALATIWSGLLGVEQIGRKDNFFYLGGNSLLVVRLISRLRDELEIEISVSDVFTHPVLLDLAIMMQASTGMTIGDSDMESSDKPASFFPISERLKISGQVSDPYCPLVTIQTGTREMAPLFCIPGAGDNVVAFAALATELGSARPVHAFQPRGLDGQQLPYKDVDDAAEDYCKTLQTFFPTGPVHLLGHSFGGWVAFQMAQRLNASGRVVASLTLIDSDVPGNNTDSIHQYTRTSILLKMIELYEQNSGCSMQIKQADLDSLDGEGQLRLIHKHLVRTNIMPINSGYQDILGSVLTFEASVRTVYQPSRAYIAPMNLILVDEPMLSEESNRELFTANTNQWQRWAPKLTVWKGPGNHVSVLKPPHVKTLSAWLCTRLRKMNGMSRAG
ncbi:non-ribosomal peptide synthetase [Microbulbifer sp. 2205BS26-8]|uniref:non-ribosomal peptide synthetase n=1 Tax=Microbulbifer sp. 2205BS26-8 TaxID=3064386 RepID=UPI00273D81E5|nr:non-ribosomal peptide synthetase [Microbulbifer sp. 2205BS26-8]MDP5209824.1 amino acid adenylation domain-containing protein [Microbulbifer sp. 2205BS26-8]